MVLIHLIIWIFLSPLHYAIPLSLTEDSDISSKAQWLLYVSPGLPFWYYTFCRQKICMCFAWDSEQIAVIYIYGSNCLVFVIEECVYSAVRAESLNVGLFNSCYWALFAILRKANISFVFSGRVEQLGSHWTDFHEMLYLSIFRKSFVKIRVLLKSDKNKEYFTGRPIHIFFIISRSFLRRMRSVSDKLCRENQNTYFVFGNFFFFQKIVPFVR